MKYSASTLINVVDFSLIEFENVYENIKIKANNFLAQKGDSGYPLWWTDQECKQPYQVILHFLHMLKSKINIFSNKSR